jgi:hypothetical protein
MLIPFGVLSAAGADVEPVFEDAFELIATTILTANTGSVTFSNLGDYSATYKHLQIRMTSRDDIGGTVQNFEFAINGVAGTSYATHKLIGNGSSVSSINNVSQAFHRAGISTSSGSTANAFGSTVIDVLDAYSTTKNTTARSLSGIGGVNVRLVSGLFNNTASVASIRINNFSNFVAGSRFSIYGIRG